MQIFLRQTNFKTFN